MSINISNIKNVSNSFNNTDFHNKNIILKKVNGNLLVIDYLYEEYGLKTIYDNKSIICKICLKNVNEMKENESWSGKIKLDRYSVNYFCKKCCIS